jgi:uroporphyrinogen decarboxylase
MGNTDLTPRERVKLALSHKETDRVPVDFLATPEFWNIIKKFLRIDSNEDVMKHLGVDVRHPRLDYIGPPLQTFPDGSYKDVWGIRWRPMPHTGGVYYEIAEGPFENIKDFGEIGEHPWPNPEWWDMENLISQIGSWDKDIEFALCFDDFGDPGGFYEIAGYMRGMERLLFDMAERPDIVNEIISAVTDFFCVLAERLFSRLGNRIDLIWTSDDIAHQHGLIMSTSMWQDLIYPHHKRFNQRVHEMGGTIMYHSCGSIMEAIPGLIDMDIDVLDVLQFSADNMAPDDIKRRYGDTLSFHGGADIQHMLPNSSQTEVVETISQIITTMGRGGGFVLSPCHAVQIDTPPENIVAMFETAGSISGERQ